MAIITATTILANRPDIVIHNKNKYTSLLIDVSILENSNFIPVIVGALGMIRKNIKCYIQMVLGNSPMFEVQKIVLMGSAQVLRNVLG